MCQPQKRVNKQRDDLHITKTAFDMLQKQSWSARQGRHSDPQVGAMGGGRFCLEVPKVHCQCSLDRFLRFKAEDPFDVGVDFLRSHVQFSEPPSGQ